MLNIFKFLFLFIICTPFMVLAQNESFNVMTYNIRFDGNYPGDTMNTWDKRKDHLVGLIRFHETGIFGTQEGLYHQLNYIKSGMDSFEWFGMSRDGKGTKGEYSAIFYDTKLFELTESGTFWLSETPGEPSKAWDAALPRICTWGKFRHLASGNTFYFFNTHFDHVGEEARRKSAELIMEKIKSMSADSPVLLTGDFNVPEDTQVYRTLTSGELKDALKLSKTGHYGAEGTFSAFEFTRVPSPRIDYIFVSNDFEVLRHATLTDSYELKYPSDHLPVFAEVKFN